MKGENFIPLACTLTAEQLREGRGDLLPGLMERADEVSELKNGVQLRFAPRPGLLVELAGVIEREQTCCQFLSFRLEVAPQAAVVLEVTGPEGTRELLRSLYK
ncbi:hypothetical protein IAD21_04566 [Abditibacteriota bacterium]|nr:hypothetical protein IAD21_04566 [Abditibacteriota bacterium]